MRFAFEGQTWTQPMIRETARCGQRCKQVGDEVCLLLCFVLYWPTFNRVTVRALPNLHPSCSCHQLATLSVSKISPPALFALEQGVHSLWSYGRRWPSIKIHAARRMQLKVLVTAAMHYWKHFNCCARTPGRKTTKQTCESRLDSVSKKNRGNRKTKNVLHSQAAVIYKDKLDAANNSGNVCAPPCPNVCAPPCPKRLCTPCPKRLCPPSVPGKLFGCSEFDLCHVYFVITKPLSSWSIWIMLTTGFLPPQARKISHRPSSGTVATQPSGRQAPKVADKPSSTERSMKAMKQSPRFS